MTISITGIGTAVPEGRIAQNDAYRAAEQLSCDYDEHRRVMTLIYEGTNVRGRNTVLRPEVTAVSDRDKTFFWQRRDENDRGPTISARMQKYEECSLGLGLKSSQAAIANANLSVDEITHLVTVSCSGCVAPGFDIGLIEELGLSAQTARTHIGFMGCQGMFNALRIAKAFIDAESEAVVLICSVELCSLHHHYGWSIEKVTANALFGDGAGAAVCRAAHGSGSSSSNYQLLRNGAFLIPGTKKSMTWRVGDRGFEMTLSRRIPSLIKRNQGPWMRDFLAKMRLTIEGVQTWAIHGLGPCILESFFASLSPQSDQVTASRNVLAEYGNMSSATILFVLERIQRIQTTGAVVALGIGPGLTIEAMLLMTDV